MTFPLKQRLSSTGVAAGTITAGIVLGGTPGSAGLDQDSADDLQLVAASTTSGQSTERRRIVRYVVKRGDTATGLAVRFHAWTDELLAMNHLAYRSTIRVGRELRIPVVPARLRPDAPEEAPASRHREHHTEKAGHRRTWTHADPSRRRVARVITRTSRRYGVDPQLALAVSWQEAGWQMHHISTAQAIGAMQVLRETGAWMSLYVGRPLHLYRLEDNAAAGVMLLKVLREQTPTRKRAIGAYYQGLGAVRRHGLYRETRHYVHNVLAIERRLENGDQPG